MPAETSVAALVTMSVSGAAVTCFMVLWCATFYLCAVFANFGKRCFCGCISSSVLVKTGRRISALLAVAIQYT
jgi:hypothetical protein